MKLHACLFCFSFCIWPSVYAGFKNLILRLEFVLILVLKVQHLAIFAHRSVPTLEKFRLLKGDIRAAMSFVHFVVFSL